MTPADNLAFVVREPGADAAAVKAGITKVIADLPTVTLKDQAEFAAEQRGPIDQMLYMIYALLGLAVVIAVLGIINTLALSVIERTREIGLLRAVGLSRRQLRTMLRLESVVISLLGAALGVGLGVAFGIALSSEGIDVLSVPVGQLAVFVGLRAWWGAGRGLAGPPGSTCSRPSPPNNRGLAPPVSPGPFAARATPRCGPYEHPDGACLRLRVLRSRSREDRADAVEGRPDLSLGALPLADHALEPRGRRAGPGVLQAHQPGHHRGDLAVDLGRDALDVGRCGLDALGVHLELRRHAAPPDRLDRGRRPSGSRLGRRESRPFGCPQDPGCG